MSSPRYPEPTLAGDVAAVTDQLLRVSRALVAVAGRSIASVDADITLVQFRALVVLARTGPSTMGELAELLGVHRSTATRLCDRLVGRQLVRRETSATNRREVVVSLTAEGARLVTDVNRIRRDELAGIVGRMPPRGRAGMVAALAAFAAAAGEPPEDAVAAGWAP